MPEPRSFQSPKPPSWSEWKARTGRRFWLYPFVIEWALEWLVYGLRHLALFDLLEIAGRLTVLVAVVIWFLEADDRAKERHYRAWELINAARGSTGDGGRKDALQDLNKDGVSLAGAPLEKAYLLGVDLRGAFLTDADLQAAYLAGANLQGAILEDANLRDANLAKANLQDTNLVGANLQGAGLLGLNLQDGTFLLTHDVRAILRHFGLEAKRVGPRTAHLERVDLRGAYLIQANLQDAKLMAADLRGADLQDADLKRTNLMGANLQDARNLTQEQLNAANGDDETVLPEGLTRPAQWPKTEATEDLPEPQLDRLLGK